MSIFQKATKKQAKLRLAVFGPAGAGKTFTSLRIASGLGKTIAVIDTERGSASKYSDRFTFDVAEAEDKSIEGIVSIIDQAEHDVLIIDSLSHAWQELLEEVERIAKAKYRGNSWSAWSDGTPKQRKLVDSILNYNGHIIATMRTKTEWTTSQTSNGKTQPVRVGLAPEQGKGIEYEFDMLMEINPDHIGNIIKDRTGKYQDKLIEKPGEELGKELKAWLSDGATISKPKNIANREPRYKEKEPLAVLDEKPNKTLTIEDLLTLANSKKATEATLNKLRDITDQQQIIKAYEYYKNL